MTIERKYIVNYVDALSSISESNKALLKRELLKLPSTLNATDYINRVVEVMQTVCVGSRDQAATLAAQFYRGLREAELGATGFEPIVDTGYDAGTVEGSTRAVAQKYVDGNPDAFEVELMRIVGRNVQEAAGKTLFVNGIADKRRPRFARVPTGSKSYADGCPFCRMLASRGFVYLSTASAGKMNHYHDDCRCAIVPSWSKSPIVNGYNPDSYIDGYLAFKSKAANERPSVSR